MARNADDLFVGLSKERLGAIDANAQAMLAEEMTLIELRKKLVGSQAKLGQKMGIKQAAVSRMENRADMHINTLKQIIHAMGGKIRILAQFVDRPAIFVNLGDALDGITQPTPKRAAASVGSYRTKKAAPKPPKKAQRRRRLAATKPK